MGFKTVDLVDVALQTRLILKRHSPVLTNFGISIRQSANFIVSPKIVVLQQRAFDIGHGYREIGVFSESVVRVKISQR